MCVLPLIVKHSMTNGGILARSSPLLGRCDSWWRGFATSNRGGVALIIGAGEGAGQVKHFFLRNVAHIICLPRSLFRQIDDACRVMLVRRRLPRDSQRK